LKKVEGGKGLKKLKRRVPLLGGPVPFCGRPGVGLNKVKDAHCSPPSLKLRRVRGAGCSRSLS